MRVFLLEFDKPVYVPGPDPGLPVEDGVGRFGWFAENGVGLPCGGSVGTAWHRRLVYGDQNIGVADAGGWPLPAEVRPIVSSNTLHVALVQMSCTADKQANIARAVEHTRQAASRGAQIVCHQELFASLYFCQTEDHSAFALADTIPGPTTQLFCELARELRISLICSLFERRTAGLYHNTAITITPDGAIASIYRKMHIPDDPAYYEKFYFAPGDNGFLSVEVPAGRGPAPIGTLVCWDQWYPEAARLTVLAGAQVLFYPTAIGWHPAEKAQYGQGQHSAWETIQRSHAVANGVWVCVVNRVGHEPAPVDPATQAAGRGIEFWGQSFVADPMGQIVARASPDQEEILLVPIDLAAVETARTHWPFLRDRRIDAYGEIATRFRR